ncbi:MAG: hypothetical protein WCS24_12670 [Methanoculleus sp.]
MSLTVAKTAARVVLVQPEQGVDDVAEQVVVVEQVRVVQADDQALLLPLQGAADRVHHRLDRDTGPRRSVAEDRGINSRKDHVLRPVVLAVHVDRHDLLGGLLELGKDPEHAGRLPGPGQTPADGGEGPPAFECGTDLVGKVVELALAVVEELRDVIDLEDIDTPEECLVGHEESRSHTKIVGRWLFKREPCAW